MEQSPPRPQRVRFDSETSDLTASLTAVPPPPPGGPPTRSTTHLREDDDRNSSRPSRTSTPRFQAEELRGNLMRELVDRDPLFNYEVVKVLGVGSMGSVTKVRKRGSAIGGSARRKLQQHFSRERRINDCGNIPCFGSLFQQCLQGLVWKPSSPSDNDVASLVVSEAASSNRHDDDVDFANQLIEDEKSDNASSDTYQVVYAMKSIHLSRVTDPAFVEELRNEGE